MVVQKNATDCERLGPTISGFNQAACDIFQGMWCPAPRSCFGLVKCIRDLKEEVDQSRTRRAFFEYLDGAPTVNDVDGETEDTEKCGDLREYFEYDRDYPDDDRICEEVTDVQCLTDFSNLDAFATGVPGTDGGGALEQLAVSTVLTLNTKERFDAIAARIWRNARWGIGKIMELLDLKKKTVAEPANELCSIVLPTVAGIGPGTILCKLPAVAALTGLKLAKEILKIALSISDHIYAELVDKTFNLDHELGRQQAIYENVITIHGNIITTFKATQQLKSMLGDISDGLEEDRQDNEGRRLIEAQGGCFPTDIFGYGTCVTNQTLCLEYSETPPATGDCILPACEDLTRLCDRSFNFPYIATLKQAGCDELDSDGNGIVDQCEDRFPPSVVLRNAELFRCNDDDYAELCYTGKVFNGEKQLMNFLNYQFPASDDCQISPSKLKVDISYEDGDCHNTKYKVTPYQNISECDNYDPGDCSPLNGTTFENPLYGLSKDVTVQLDVAAPEVKCGFLYDTLAMKNISDDSKTLYHYMPPNPTSGDVTRLIDARLFYNVSDNCDEDDIIVDINVKSNEIQQNKIATAELFTRKKSGFVGQVNFLYAPTHCDCKNRGFHGLCMTDPSMSSIMIDTKEFKTRYYEITVTATDSAGNAESDTCKVIIVPDCDSDSSVGCEMSTFNEAYYYTQSVVDTSIDSSTVLYEIASKTLVWERGLSLPSLDDFLISEAVDIDDAVPLVTCSLGTQNLTGKGAGVFTDLAFDFTAVDGGNKCTATEDLKVTIEVLSNEMVANGENMVYISKTLNSGEAPHIVAEDSTCNSASNGKCIISSVSKYREYLVRVMATDEAGNSKTCVASTYVGKDGDTGQDPLFLVTSVDIVGGIEPEGTAFALRN